MSILDGLAGGQPLTAFLAGLQPPDLDELVLLATEDESEDVRDLAHAVLTVLHRRGDPRYRLVQEAWSTFDAKRNAPRRERPPLVLETPVAFASVLSTHYDTRLPISDGRVLCVSPGDLFCSVDVRVIALDAAQFDSSDRLDCTLRLSDSEGRTYGATRPLYAGSLLDLASSNAWPGVPGRRRVLARNVRMFNDSRTRVPAIAYVGPLSIPFAYRVKYFWGMCDLLKMEGVEGMADHLLVRVHTTQNAGFPDGPTPSLTFAIDGLPALILNGMPGGQGCAGLTFEPLADVGAPQPLVRSLS